MPFEYWAIVSIPDSTDYFLQKITSAVTGSDGRRYIYVGDDLHITAYNWRHILNGTCWIWVDRNRENVGGKFAGKRTVIQGLAQQFVGDGIIRQTSWPIEPVHIPITSDWFDDPNVDEQEMDIFTTGYYNCNPLDQIRIALGIPRVHHNAKGLPERVRSRVVLRRYKDR
jgi:hypothetical protein